MFEMQKGDEVQLIYFCIICLKEIHAYAQKNKSIKPYDLWLTKKCTLQARRHHVFKVERRNM